MSKQNHSCDITQVSVQKTHDFGTVAAVWQVFWGRSSAYIKCHRSAEVNGAVTTYTHGGSALLCTIPAIIGLHRTQSPGCVTIVAQSALQTASWRAAQLIAEGRADSPSNFRSVWAPATGMSTRLQRASFGILPFQHGELKPKRRQRQAVLGGRSILGWRGQEARSARPPELGDTRPGLFPPVPVVTGTVKQ